MSDEPALKLVPQEDEVTKEVTTVEGQAKALKIVDAASYITAGELWKSIKALRAKVADTFDDLIKAAHLAHKKAVEKKRLHDDPLDAAERMVKRAMSDYEAAQEAIRKAEEARLAEIARVQAEEQALLEAIAAEEDAKRNGATAEEAAEVSAAVISEPVYVPPVVVPKAVPKMQGGPTYSTRWSASVTDIRALCLAIGTGKASPELVIGLNRDRETGIVTSPSLNTQATSLKNTLCIPGVTAISRRV